MEHRHTVQDPPEDQYVNRYNRKYNHRLPPWWNDVLEVIRKLPVERYDGDIESVEDNANDGIEGSKSHQSHALNFNTHGVQEHRDHYEAQDLEKEPVPIGCIQEMPVSVMGNADGLKYKIDEHAHGSALPQTERQLGKALPERLVGPVLQETI